MAGRHAPEPPCECDRRDKRAEPCAADDCVLTEDDTDS